MSASVPIPLKALTHQRTNRLLSGVYPFVRSMRSSDGEKNPLRFFSGENGIPVSSQRPVHLDSAHSNVSSKGGRLLWEVRCFAVARGCFQGFSTRSFLPLTARAALLSDRRSPVHRAFSNALQYSLFSALHTFVFSTLSARLGAFDLASISRALSGFWCRQFRACHLILQGWEQNRWVRRPGLNVLPHSKQALSSIMVGLWPTWLTPVNHNLCQEAA